MYHCLKLVRMTAEGAGKALYRVNRQVYEFAHTCNVLHSSTIYQSKNRIVVVTKSMLFWIYIHVYIAKNFFLTHKLSSELQSVFMQVQAVATSFAIV